MRQILRPAYSTGYLWNGIQCIQAASVPEVSPLQQVKVMLALLLCP